MIRPVSFLRQRCHGKGCLVRAVRSTVYDNAAVAGQHSHRVTLKCEMLGLAAPLLLLFAEPGLGYCQAGCAECLVFLAGQRSKRVPLSGMDRSLPGLEGDRCQTIISVPRAPLLRRAASEPTGWPVNHDKAFQCHLAGLCLSFIVVRAN